MTPAQRIFQQPWFVALYDRVRESPAAAVTCGLTFRGEVDRYAGWLSGAPGRRFLEVACGQGSFGVAVAGKVPGARFCALDLSPAQLRRAGRKAAAGGARYARVRGDAQRLPFHERAFDGALCVGGLHQIPDPAVAVQEVARALRPGAVFCGGCFTLSPAWTRPVGMNPMSREDIARWLGDAGFSDVRCDASSRMWCLFRAVRGGEEEAVAAAAQ